MSPSDGLVVVGVHSAKFPNEKVRNVGFVCTVLLYFCNWIASIRSCHALLNLRLFFGSKDSFSEAIKYCRCNNNMHKNISKNPNLFWKKYVCLALKTLNRSVVFFCNVVSDLVMNKTIQWVKGLLPILRILNVASFCFNKKKGCQ